MIRTKRIISLFLAAALILISAQLSLAAESVKLKVKMDTFASLSKDGSASSTVMCVGGDEKYVSFLRFETGQINAADYPNITLNITTYNKPLTANTIYVYGVYSDERSLVASSISGKKAQYAPLFELRADELLSEKTNNPTPNKKTTLSFDVTDYVRAQKDGILAFRVYQEGSGGKYGYQMYSLENTASPDYAPFLSFNTGSEFELKYDATHFEIEDYVENPDCVESDFTLPEKAEFENSFGSSIAWVSENSSVIKIDKNGYATVTPMYMEETTVTVTAIFEKDGKKEGRSFYLTVPAGTIPPDDKPTEAADDFELMINNDFDTYIRKGSSSSEDYSDASTMIIDGRASSLRYGVVRLHYGAAEGENPDVIAEDANAVVLRMKIKLNDGNGDLALYGINDELMKTLWEDSEMTYDKAGELGILAAIGSDAVPLVDIVPLEGKTGGDYIYADITDYAKKQASKLQNGVATFAFIVAGANCESENDIFRIEASYSTGTDTEAPAKMLVYSGGVGYAFRDSINLEIEKRFQVTENFSLPTALGTERGDSTESTVTWKSSNKNVIDISDNGDEAAAVVSRPDSSAVTDAYVKLTATVQNGSAVQTKSFSIYVLPSGIYNPVMSNYITNSSKGTSNPNKTVSTYVDGSTKQYGFVKFHSDDGLFSCADKVILRMKPYYMQGAFTLTMTPINPYDADSLTEDMTWSTAQDLCESDSIFSVTHEQSSFQTSWIEWDVTDYIKDCVSDEAVFRFEIDSESAARCMLYGNSVKFLPQLKLCNYELISDAEKSIDAAAKELSAMVEAQDFGVISGDITLPEVFDYGVWTEWEMTDENGNESELLSNDGTLIKLPAEDTPVVLTATISRGDTDYTRNVTAYGTVRKSVTPEEAVSYNLEHLNLNERILVQPGQLPQGFYGADITWKSSDAALKINGNAYSVERDEKNKVVTLTAFITADGYEAAPAEKEFTVTVLRNEKLNLLLLRPTLDGSAEETNDGLPQTYYAPGGSDSITYELIEKSNIGSMEIIAHNSSEVGSLRIEIRSDEKSEWKTAVSGAVLTDSINSFAIDGADVKFVRISADFGENGGICEAAAYEGAGSSDDIYFNSDKFAEACKLPADAVTEDFYLPRSVGGIKVTWTSKNSSYISLFETNDGYNAKVSRGKNNENVTLAAEYTDEQGNTYSRSFTVTVKAEKQASSGGGGSSGGSGYGSAGKGASSVTTPSGGQTTEEYFPFSDMQGAEWAKEYVKALYEKGIVNGAGNGMFFPGNSVTRAEFVKMLVAALNIEAPASVGFDDVSPEHWSYKFICAAQGAGIINGIGDNKFGGDMEITRQDIAAAAVRAAEYTGFVFHDYSGVTAPDLDAASDYAADALRKLMASGIICGDESGMINPLKKATRAETAKIILLLLKYVNTGA